MLPSTCRMITAMPTSKDRHHISPQRTTSSQTERSRFLFRFYRCRNDRLNIVREDERRIQQADKGSRNIYMLNQARSSMNRRRREACNSTSQLNFRTSRSDSWGLVTWKPSLLCVIVAGSMVPAGLSAHLMNILSTSIADGTENRFYRTVSKQVYQISSDLLAVYTFGDRGRLNEGKVLLKVAHTSLHTARTAAQLVSVLLLCQQSDLRKATWVR